MQAHPKIRRIAKVFGVRSCQLPEQSRQARAVRRRGERLVGISASLGHDSGRFAPPDQLCAAATKIAPAAQRVLARRAVALGVPAFHRVNAPAISHGESADLQRHGQRRTGFGGEDFVIDGQRQPQLIEPAAQLIDRLELRDFGISGFHAGRESRCHDLWIQNDLAGRSWLCASMNFFWPADEANAIVAERLAPLPLSATTLPSPYSGCRTTMPW